MPFNYDQFISSPLTGIGLGLLSSRRGDPIGDSITRGLLLSDKFRTAQAERENSALIRQQQQEVLRQQQQNYQLQQQKFLSDQNDTALKRKWAELMGAGNVNEAMAIDPLATTQVIKESNPPAPSSIQEKINLLQSNPDMYRKLFPPEQGRAPSEYEQYLQNPEGYAKFIATKNGSSSDGMGPLTNDAINTAATRYLIDGTLPPMGMGKAAAEGRSAILNRAAELGQNSGLDPEQQRLFQIGTSANKAALGKLSQQKTMVGAFEKNFVKNADLALGISDNMDRTGTPIVNKWINSGKRAVTGDPELAKFDVSLKATVNEYAKIISGSLGNTALAEGEIKKVESMLNAAQTPEQVKEVINFMKLETQNRMDGFNEQEKELRAGMAMPRKQSPLSTLSPMSAHSSGKMDYQGYKVEVH